MYGLGGIISKVKLLIIVPIVTKMISITAYYRISGSFHVVVQLQLWEGTMHCIVCFS